MKVMHDIFEAVIAVGVMVMFLAVMSLMDIGDAKHDPKPPQTQKAVIHVDAAYTGTSQNGSTKHPFHTIQDAINYASSGQTVMVAPGVYYGTIELKSGVRLESSGGPSATVIDAQGGYYAVMSPYGQAPDSSIAGFTIRNASVLVDIRNRVSMWSPANLEISDCVLHDATRGMTVTAGGYADIKTTVFTDLYRAMATLWNTNCYLKNVTIDNVEYAFALNDSIFTAHNTSISRSGCVAQLRGGERVHVVRGSNNNVCDCTNMTEPSSDGLYPEVCFDNLLEVNPMFVAPDSMDYHLQAGSPLIDQGVDVGLPYYGSAPDIGAYEFVPAGMAAGSEFTTATQSANLVLPESYGDPVPEYRDEGERLRNELHTVVMDVLDGLSDIDKTAPVQEQVDTLMALRNRLEQEVLARADGFYGGDPLDDWITTKTEQHNVVTRIDGLIALIDKKIDKLMALTQ